MNSSTARCSNTVVFTLRLALILGTLAAWEFSVRFGLADPFFMSQPTAILLDIIDAFVTGEIMPHIIVTMKEAMGGLLIGTSAGIATALVLWKIDLLARILDPIIMAFYGIPKLALGPIFILWFGLGIQSKIFLAALMVYFLVLFNAYAGFKNVDQALVIAARLMGAKKGQIMLKVILPSSAPWLLAGMKAGLGAALLGAVVGEYIGASAGLGWMVEYAGGMYDIARVFTCIITLMLIMAVLNAILGVAERYFLKWRPASL